LNQTPEAGAGDRRAFENPEHRSFGKDLCRMTKKKGTAPRAARGNEPKRLVSENRKARHRFEILEQLECGIVLVGSEVKSLRDGKLSLGEAYVRARDGELWLVGADIAEYGQATLWNHAPKRPRKLLANRRQLNKLVGRIQEKGLTLVPLSVYFNERGIAKVLVGVARGKKLYDKREALRSADVKRQMARALRKK
jgi:SsrA-binding protein